ncbi:PAS-domain containing protein [Primorskyibacter flagellatus]|uniref:PAS-domain containing protein n=1 Tax=Primorskyibacter flagellatus TaxID=1387277 RepID=UPI00166AD651|nr:PAS-domain containing protein [Primorskyibacter flagellatus]
MSHITLVLIVSLATATAAVLIIQLLPGYRRRRGIARKTSGGMRMIRGRIVDCDADLTRQLQRDDWDNTLPSLRKYFSFRYSDVPAEFVGDTDGTVTYPARDPEDPSLLRIARRGQSVSVDLVDSSVADPMSAHLRLYRDRIRALTRWSAMTAPYPVWLTDVDGCLLWSNTAYAQIEAESGGARPDGRPALPPEGEVRGLPDREQRRIRFRPTPAVQERWFDLTERAFEGTHLFHAIDVTAVVRAEVAQRTFVQTLTKTFAQLSTGLAIFDRNRQLALFNPALIDMTALTPEYLSGRPGYLSFFDKLRDEKIMPEPRSYSTWRDQILDLIAAAEDGRYQETWTLANGCTYRVTGRPHPNGAVAFLFEDISAEITLTRRYREQLDLSQAVMESLDDALAVFSPQGVLSYTNESYRDLWQLPEENSSLDQSVRSATGMWQDRCEPSPIWGDFRDFVVGFDERTEWDASVRMRDGRMLDCRFKPLQGGATLATFRVAQVSRLVGIQGRR